MKSKSAPIEVTIEDLAFGGDGVARVDGKACFVPFTMPGDVCTIRIRENRKNFMRGQLSELLQAAPDRTRHRCKVFGHCGGCQYQHMTYEAECRFKANQVTQTMQRLGGMSEPPIQPLIPSPEPYGYRNRIQVHIEQEKFGFRAGDGRSLVPIRECPIASRQLNHQLAKLRPEDIRGKRKLALADDGTAAAGFSQINRFQHETLREQVRQAFDGIGGRLIELYAGGGFFTEILQTQFTTVSAVEWDSRLVERGKESCPEVDWVHQAVEEAAPKLDWKSAGLSVLVDPPREGLPADVLDYVRSANVGRFVYLSCNPATQARDLRKLSLDWHVISITPIDLFPRTAHIESLAVLSKKS